MLQAHPRRPLLLFLDKMETSEGGRTKFITSTLQNTYSSACHPEVRGISASGFVRLFPLVATHQIILD